MQGSKTRWLQACKATNPRGCGHAAGRCRLRLGATVPPHPPTCHPPTRPPPADAAHSTPTPCTRTHVSMGLPTFPSRMACLATSVAILSTSCLSSSDGATSLLHGLLNVGPLQELHHLADLQGGWAGGGRACRWKWFMRRVVLVGAANRLWPARQQHYPTGCSRRAGKGQRSRQEQHGVQQGTPGRPPLPR